MVEKSKTDRATSGGTAKPTAQRPPAKPRETSGSAYNSFWHSLSGRPPAERLARASDATPLHSLRAAFGLAEETQPIDYGPIGTTGRTSPATTQAAGSSRDAGARPAGTDARAGARLRPRRG